MCSNYISSIASEDNLHLQCHLAGVAVLSSSYYIVHYLWMLALYVSFHYRTVLIDGQREEEVVQTEMTITLNVLTCASDRS